MSFADNIKNMANKHVLPGAEVLCNWAHNCPPWEKLLSAPPALHRALNAGGMISSWVVARKVANVMVGEDKNGNKIAKDDVIAPLRPLHGILAHNRYSDDPKDKLIHAMVEIGVAAVGGIGAVAGSLLYYKISGRQKTVSDAANAPLDKFGLEHAEMAASMKTAWPWRIMSGIAGMFAASSALPMLSFIFPLNYGFVLNKSFSTAMDRKEFGGLPEYLEKYMGPKNWLSQFFRKFSHSTSPSFEGAAGTLGQLSKFCSKYTKTLDQKKLDEYCDGVLHQWFEKITPEQVEAFKNKIIALRDGIIRDNVKGGAKAIEAQLKDTLGKKLEGPEFFQFLVDAGIDKETLSHVNLANHGWTRLISTALGVKFTGIYDKLEKSMQRVLEDPGFKLTRA